jgi:hypothetical protein
VAQVWALFAPSSIQYFAPNSYIAQSSGSVLKVQSGYSVQGVPVLWGPVAEDGSTGGIDGVGGWSFVPYPKSSGWGQVVNSATGLCLRANLAEWNILSVDRCASSGGGFATSAPRGTSWDVYSTTGGVKLKNMATSDCLSNASSFGVTSSCPTVAPLTISATAPSGSVSASGIVHDETKRSLKYPGFSLIGQGSGRCLNVVGSPSTLSGAGGSATEIRDCATNASQLWNENSGAETITVFDPLDDVNVLSGTETAGLCLSAPNPASDGSPASVASCINWGGSQQWTMSGNGNVINVASGLCLSVQNASSANGASVILWNCNNGSNEEWSFNTGLSDPGSSLYANFGSSRAMTSSGSDLVLGAGASGTTPGGDGWAWVPDGGSNGLLLDVTSGQCLGESPGSNTYYGTAVVLGPCAPSAGSSPTSQDWVQSQNTNGTTSFTLSQSLSWHYSNALGQSFPATQCLDVQGNNDSAGANVYLYLCGSGYSNQQWNVIVPQSGTASTDSFPAGGSGADSAEGVNWAEGGMATQSSTWGNGSTSNADLALDGAISGNDSVSDIAATNSQQYSWWQDDMGDSYQISTVKNYNRTDCCTSTMANYYVFTSNTPFNTLLTPQAQATTAGVTSTYEAGAAGTPTTVVLPAGTTARYLMIQGAGTGAIFLAQVTTTSSTYSTLTDSWGYCLSAQGGGAFATVGANTVVQAPCTSATDGLQWAWDSGTDSLSVWYGGALYCAQVTNTIFWYQAIYATPCLGAANQQWVYNPSTGIFTSATNPSVAIGYDYWLTGAPPILGANGATAPLDTGSGGPDPFAFG